MSRSAGPAGQDAGRPPAAGQPQGDGPEQPPGDGAGHRAGEPDGGWGRRLGHPLTLVVAGAVALVAGAAIALAAVRITGPPPGGGAAPFSSASPSAGTGASGNGAPLAALPPLSGSAGQPVRQLMIIDRVTAVSRASITISAQGHAMTAAITSRTRVTGRVRRAAAIKAGDTVSAQIDEKGSPTVLAIQDPGSVP